jgi:methyltransferase cognate corrinoid proteins, Methanosarcina family
LYNPIQKFVAIYVIYIRSNVYVQITIDFIIDGICQKRIKMGILIRLEYLCLVCISTDIVHICACFVHVLYGGKNMSDIFKEIADAVTNQNINGTVEKTKEALAQGIPALDIVQKGLSEGMKVVGDKFEAGTLFLPQIMMSAKAMNNAMELVQPELTKAGGGSGSGLAISFVQSGDIHDIGNRLVSTMLGANGFTVKVLGVDVDNEVVIDEIRKAGADKVLLVGSALMTTSMLGQKDLMLLINEEGVRGKVKCMFGGAPVSQSWIEEIGADGTAENAAEAVLVAKKIMA